ncbi:MAG TPA: type II toxin-antitoxin system HicB family antitoxin [Stellaceae bacterium]|nr:type II toxin-antitoxin system HicB family antitoxin [Stellaceae bacterium]
MLKIEMDREEDGRWIAEVPAIPGALAYGASEIEARVNVEALAFRVIAERLEHGEPIPAEAREIFAAA